MKNFIVAGMTALFLLATSVNSQAAPYKSDMTHSCTCKGCTCKECKCTDCTKEDCKCTKDKGAKKCCKKESKKACCRKK